MSKYFEYAIMMFLIGLLVILFRWSEKDNYKFYQNSQGHVFNPDTGETWFVNGYNTSYVLDKSLSSSAGTALKDLKRLK